MFTRPLNFMPFDNVHVKPTLKNYSVYISENDNSIASLALSTAHPVNTRFWQPHRLTGCHIFFIILQPEPYRPRGQKLTI